LKENDELKMQVIQLATQFERLQNEFGRHQQLCGLMLPTTDITVYELYPASTP